MTDKIHSHRFATKPAHDLDDQRLPPELEVAVRRARERQPEADDVMGCISRAKRLSQSPASPRKPVRIMRQLTVFGTLTAAAAAVYLMVTGNTGPTVPEPERPLGVSLSLPVYSPITRIPLVEVGYRRIEEDLDLADAELAQASETLALSAVRVEVQQTLEEFYDWSGETR